MVRRGVLWVIPKAGIFRSVGAEYGVNHYFFNSLIYFPISHIIKKRFENLKNKQPQRGEIC